MKWFKSFTFLLTSGLIFSFGFQNCAKVPLEELPLEQGLSYASGKMEICLDSSLSSYTVESIFTLNLNLIPHENGVELDSDGDGIPDIKEYEYGFDPFQRRSQSPYTDSICLDLANGSGCQETVVACNSQRNALGLSDCDIMVLGLDLLHPHPDQGLDTDKDSIADLIEILRGTNPGQIDDLADPDNDRIRNNDEIAQGSATLSYNSGLSKKFQVITSLQKSPTPPSGCSGEFWDYNIEQVPFFPFTNAINDELDGTGPVNALSFTRPAKTNTILTVVKLKPRLGESGHSKILYRSQVVSEKYFDLSADISSFHQAGEVEP